MWKKTSEELPKYSDNVMLALWDEESDARYVVYGNRYCTDAVGERYRLAASSGGEKILVTVYAWMSLPKAPAP